MVNIADTRKDINTDQLDANMTDEEQYEHVKAMASVCFSELTILRRSENALQQIVTRHWDHPAFKEYMTRMGLCDAFAPFRLTKSR